MTRIYAGRSDVQILAEAIELSIVQNIQTSSSAHPASKFSFFSGSKVASADSLTTHICLEPSLKISGATPPLNLSPSTAHSGTSFYPNHLPLYISLKRSHPFWSYKGTFLYITFPLHSHYMTHLFHLQWSNYINIMNSYNNKPHYIIFCVLLLLTPSTGQIVYRQLFSLSPSKYVIPSMWHVTFYTIKTKGMFDLLMDETFHYKRHFACREYQNKGFFS